VNALLSRARIPAGARAPVIALLAGIVLFVASELLSEYNNLQLATGCYYFAALAGLTLLTGLSGQISLGHGALMAVGAYTAALLIGNEHWPLLGAVLAATVMAALVGLVLGAAATRLRGPYLAGATLAFAVGLPALADKYPGTFGGENGLTIEPPTPPAFLGREFPLERWEAWIAGIGAVVVLLLAENLRRSGMGRAFRAIRDDEIAASLCGYSVARVQLTAFVFSAACAGLGGALLAVVLQLAAPGAFQLQLSLSLLTAIVVGGLGSLAGAVWGAAFLVLLPGWSNDIANSFSLSTKVSSNLPLAIYGVVLIVVMLVWPTGIQGGARAAISRLRRARGRPGTGPGTPRKRELAGAASGPVSPASGGEAALTNQRGDPER